MLDPESLRAKIRDAAPTLWDALSKLAVEWTIPIFKTLPDHDPRHSFPKTINDPIWGTIELLPWEVLLLDSPVLQRLRGVRQLGMAQHVYPGASHSRLEHSLGVLEAADRMIRWLARNAEHRRQFGIDADADVPEPDQLDRHSVRLAPLLHDIGHGSFSHVTEPSLRDRHSEEFEKVEDVLRENFEGITKIATSETIAALIILGQEMKTVFEHPHFGAVSTSARLAPAIAARILGSRSLLKAGYLSGVISGPLDADKLDYMARDSHYTGLPAGIDINRLISKLEVVVVTTDNAPNEELRQRAQSSGSGRFYEMGISLNGLGAYEQMIIARVILYDRVYYHHKVRAAEAMVRQLIAVAEAEQGRRFELKAFFTGTPDDAMLSVLGGELRSEVIGSGKERAKKLATALRNRSNYHRAYAFASRFIDGLDGLPSDEQQDTS
jgi:HD superfamily phosphohydrolase